MNKKKIDINQLKKNTLKGKKFRTINVKYETVFAYFKQKEVNQKDIFQTNFFPLISDLLNQFNMLDIISRLQNNSKEIPKVFDISNSHLKLDVFNLKRISTQSPISDIAQCLYVHKDQKTKKISLGISSNKLKNFSNSLRNIYSDFCYCVGEKYILQSSQFKNLYEAFQVEWNRKQQKRKSSNLQKIEKKICKSLYFLGVLIQNNIFSAIEERQRKKTQDLLEFGTKSQKKRNIKGQNNQGSSTYSICSNDLVSNISMTLKSQKSNQEDLIIKNQYSQKSQKILSKPRFKLFNKAQISNLKVRLYPSLQNHQMNSQQNYQINYLSNDVENILIEQAFKLQKFKDGYQRAEYGTSSYYNFNYAPSYQYQCFEVTPEINSHNQLQQIKRSYDFYNLVETRKNSNYKHITKNYN